MADMKIGIVGAAGRMGVALVRAATEARGCRVAAATERAGHAALGKDAGVVAGIDPLGIALGKDAAALFKACDAVLDFTAPEAAVAHAALAARHGIIFVTGTTGLSSTQQAKIRAAAKKVAVVQAPNFSVGVNLVMALVEQAAGVLDDGYDIEIVEMHHRHKVDAPSGTALGLGRAAAKGRGVTLEKVSERGRDGITGARKAGAIGFAALRGGDVVGDHTVIFAGPGERVEITHKAGGREVFASGAVRAALWAKGRKPGLYSMADVLGFAR
jgi:4-hydroxy-tetrahydrodipicolinate reductase